VRRLRIAELPEAGARVPWRQPDHCGQRASRKCQRQPWGALALPGRPRSVLV